VCDARIAIYVAISSVKTFSHEWSNFSKSGSMSILPCECGSERTFEKFGVMHESPQKGVVIESVTISFQLLFLNFSKISSVATLCYEMW